MRGDTGPAFGQAHRMILTEHGLHFAKGGDRWRFVELPSLVMLRGVERYLVNGRTFLTLGRRCGTWRRGCQPDTSKHRPAVAARAVIVQARCRGRSRRSAV